MIYCRKDRQNKGELLSSLEMKNKRMIVINGFSRGGTNILWNILQSHPEVVSSIYETGQLFKTLKVPALRAPLSRLGDSKLFQLSGLSLVFRRYVEQLKLQNLKGHPHSEDELGDNRFREEGVEYSEEELPGCAICFKSLNEDIELNPLFRGISSEVRYVGIVRNGYALCHSWVKRGQDAAGIGRLYQKYAGYLLRMQRTEPHRYLVVRFEDLISDPFGYSEKLNRFLDLSPAKLSKLRLRVKNITNEKGERVTPFGEFNRKYWFSPENVHELLVKEVSDFAVQLLTDRDRAQFERYAGSALRALGYEEQPSGPPPTSLEHPPGELRV